jgi:alkaline phosphatase D
VDGAPQLVSPYPRFKTFPTPGANVAFKFGILTDFGENGSSQPPVPHNVATFQQMDADHPDFVIIGGDFGHKNVGTLEDKRQVFKDLYSFHSTAGRYDSFVNQILRRYPVAHMWDDHDYGKNNGNKMYPYKQLTYQVLTEYFPTYALSQYGDWQKFTYAQTEFFLLDSRSQRDPNREPDGPLKSMLDGDNLGAEGQLEWLEQGLLSSTAVWKFIVTPVVFNKTLPKQDSWYGFGYEREQLAQFIRSHAISNVILLSGDAHFGAIDNGTNSGFPEMLTPGPNLLYCSTVSASGNWSEGIYRTTQHGPPCNGYSMVAVEANPPRVSLKVKDTQGKTKLRLIVNSTE